MVIQLVTNIYHNCKVIGSLMMIIKPSRCVLGQKEYLYKGHKGLAIFKNVIDGGLVATGIGALVYYFEKKDSGLQDVGDCGEFLKFQLIMGIVCVAVVALLVVTFIALGIFVAIKKMKSSREPNE